MSSAAVTIARICQGLFFLVIIWLLPRSAVAELPPGWQTLDLGVPSQEGAAAYDDGTWLLAGGGAGICQASQFRFAYTEQEEVNGITARVGSVSGGHFFSQAGVLIREDLTAGAAQAMLLTTATNGVMFQWRGASGSGCMSYSLGGIGAPVWLKLARSNTNFAAYYSSDSTNWFRMGEPQPVALGNRALVGLVVTANDDSELSTATFDNVSLAEPVFGIATEVWAKLDLASGNHLGALTNGTLNPAWPSNPASNFVQQSFETMWTNSGEVSGQRSRAFLIPPVTGDYRLGLSSANASELWLSQSEYSQDARRIAWVSAGAAPGEWSRETNQISARCFLEAGTRYYVEALALQREQGHLTVRLELPNAALEIPIRNDGAAGTRVIPFRGTQHVPGIYENPQPLTIPDGGTARFSVLVTNQGPVAYNWLVNGTNWSPNATNAVLVLPALGAAALNGAQVSCRVSNPAGAVTSAPAILQVLSDTEPPRAVRAVYAGTNRVRITFSEPLATQSATNAANFTSTNGLTVLIATPVGDGSVVDLQTEGMTEGKTFTFVINSLLDRAFTPNRIATNTIIKFFAGPYAPETIGLATPSGELVMQPDGYDLSGGGKDIGSSPDQFQFAYSFREGDFDISVRLKSLSQTDAFAKAGLMLREDLGAGSRYAGVFCTPTIGGTFFSARTFVGARATASGNVPANMPYTWLRLRRVGSLFYGYASYDGQVWQLLGSSTLSIGSGAYFGLAVCSRDPARLAQAEFRDLQPVTNAVEGVVRKQGEPLGPSSRTTGLVITEIMYHPPARSDGKDLEFVEIFNSQPWFQDLSRYSLAGDIAFKFPEGFTLPAGAYVVVGASPQDLVAIHGLQSVTGPYTNRLSNVSGSVELRDRFGALLLEARYGSRAPWPVSPDGTGHSLVLRNPSHGERSHRAWAASDSIGGSPGTSDGSLPGSAENVCINEIFARGDTVSEDYIELYNPGPGTVDLSGAYLTDNAESLRFQIPDGVRLAPGEFVSFKESVLGFGLAAAGESIFLINAAKTRVLDAIAFAGQPAGLSEGRFPDGADNFVRLASTTPGTRNSPPFAHALVINEIMYNPISGDDDDEFIEVYNRSTNRQDLTQWKLTGGVDFTFPNGTIVEPRSYFVIARNRTHLFRNYPNINPAIVAGDYNGVLSNQGERLELSYPDTIITTNSSGQRSTNTVYVLADQVEFGTGGRWGKWSDGGGSSLELINPDADNALAPSWADSDETKKAPWTAVEVTGRLENGSGGFPATQLHVIMMGVGECLLDDVEVLRPGQANLVSNGALNSSTAGWVFQGTHRLSGFEPTGGNLGTGCLRIRATGRGDTGANRIRAGFSSTLNNGESATIRAKARWLAGNPEMLLRLRGNWLEAPVRLQTPSNPGTPGDRNSRFVENPGPGITEVTHAPAVPAASEPVLVTARVADPNGVAVVRLVYRNDTSGTPAVTLAMNDAGQGGDVVAGDGVFSAILPAPNSRHILAYYVEAVDAAASPALARFPVTAPTQECLVGFGDPPVTGLLGSYRLWVTKTNVSWWSTREKNSNEPLDATFVYNNSRVVYNMQTLYSGSPFHTRNYSSPVGSACDYVISMPDDDLVLGANDFVLATTGNLGNDDTAQREQAAFWMMRELGVPSLHRRHVLVYVNGNKRGNVYEDAQQPNGDVIDEFWPGDADGQLFKIEDWFEFDDGGSSFQNSDATLGNFTRSTGEKNTARYRWNWRPRSVKDSAHDFTNLFGLVDTLRTSRPEPYTKQVDALIDVDGWMRVLAAERIVGNWDSYSYERGKNMYAYKPRNGRWQLIPWDVDFVFDLGDAATTELMSSHDGAITTLRSQPPFARAYWRAFYDAANGPLVAAKVGALLDAKYAGLQASGLTVTLPNSIKTYIASRRTYLLNQLATVAAAFNVSSVNVVGNTAVLSGTAPVGVKTIEFNGVPYPVTWTSVTAWTASVPLRPGANSIRVTGIGSSGGIFTDAVRTVSANYSGTALDLTRGPVINEIQFLPKVQGAEFVELFNPSTTATFDLSGWVFNGLSYSFPQGTLLLPRAYLVLARDREAMNLAHGVSVPVFDTFAGNLQGNGEIITVLTSETNGIAVAKVRYEAALPWPTNAGPGAALQLLDATQDGWRVANWERAGTNTTVMPQWVQVVVSGTPTSSSFYMYLESPGEIFLDDVQLVQGSVAGVGQNLIKNGDFEAALGSEWVRGSIFSQSSRSTSVKRSGASALRMISTGQGSTRATSISQEISPALSTGLTHTLSFWYLQTTNGGPLVLRLSGNGVTSGRINPAPPSGGIAEASTPGRPNSVARVLESFPAVFINEVQADNRAGITNAQSERVPWIELYNSSTNALRLDGLCLSTNFNALAAWTFPTGTTIPARGFRLVFADGKTWLSTSNEPHTSFSLTSSGPVALSRLGDRGLMQVLDYLVYTNLGPDRTFGSTPEGQSFVRRQFVYPTPGQTNNGASPGLTVALNEWMAENNSAQRDPADTDPEDWFEIYNYGLEPVDLGGYYLSDTLTDKFQFQIPQTGRYVVPPGGFLTVWADDEADQNSASRPDLHVNFRLSKDGEMIGLFAADGSTVDQVTFGPQKTDTSEGRHPDGGDSMFQFALSTPGTNNIGPNTPPDLEAIPPQTIYAGQVVEVQCYASDEDEPAQAFTFGLGATPPVGAGINPVTGLFRWVPTTPQTTSVTISVTDSGLPPKSANQTFIVNVLSLPVVRGSVTANGTGSLRLDTLQGKEYELETTLDLGSGQWSAVGPKRSGTGSEIEFVLGPAMAKQQFYRIKIY